jgi:hypothetical protein
MGEIADMMIEGDLCEACGVALDSEGYGIPRYCSSECAKDRGYDGINPDGSGRYGKRLNTEKKVPPQDVMSIKITYKGNKVFYATQQDSSFNTAANVADHLGKYLKDSFGVEARFIHPKVKSLDAGGRAK